MDLERLIPQGRTLVALVGAILFVGYWWFLGIVLPEAGGALTFMQTSEPAGDRGNDGWP